jgi:hypothetical protein
MAEWKREDYNRILRKLRGATGKRYVLMEAFNIAAGKAAEAGKEESVNIIANKYTLPLKQIKKTIKVYQYGSRLAQNIGVQIRDRSARPLHEFNHWPTEPAHKPVIVEIIKGRKRALPNRIFVQRMPNPKNPDAGHIGIFKRKGESPLPIEQMKGPSTVGMFGNKEVHEPVWNKIFETLDRQIIKEFRRLLGD